MILEKRVAWYSVNNSHAVSLSRHVYKFRMLNSALRFDSSLRLGCVIRFRHTVADIGRLKNPQRGGQNLSERYKRLERSSRGKELLVNQIGGLTPHLPSNYEERSQGNSVKVSNPSRPPKKKDITTFHGLEVPQEPREPESDGASNSRNFILSPDTFSVVRMLHVGLCDMCL